MTPSPYNTWYKRIRAAMELSLDEVVAISRMGGLDVSASRVHGWGRRQGHPHFRVMTIDEFDAFTAGLPEWAARPLK